MDIEADLLLYLDVIHSALLKIKRIREIASVEVPVARLDIFIADAHEERPGQEPALPIRECVELNGLSNPLVYYWVLFPQVPASLVSTKSVLVI